MSKFSLVDYLVMGLYWVAVVALGAYFSRRQKSLGEYLHAGGKLPWWPGEILESGWSL